jgi:hypothetical protein
MRPVTVTKVGSAKSVPVRAGHTTTALGPACRVKGAMANRRRDCLQIG